MVIVGESRRSQLISTFGVGAMFPAPEQSLMICGIDQWHADRCPEVLEPRLARSLGVSTLRSPSAGRKRGDVPVVRFPRYYFCPDCRRLDTWSHFDTSRKNPRCDLDQSTAVPSRFVIACRSGHISDFPYFRWAHSAGSPSPADGKHLLSLFTKGETSALADIDVRCSCGARRSMEGAFGARAMAGLERCRGERPWLPGSPAQDCSEIPRTIQRGGSNAWFPNVRSAISIPPWSQMHRKLRDSWNVIRDLDDKVLAAIFAQSQWGSENKRWLPERLIELVHELRDGSIPDDEGLRRQEYEALLEGYPDESPGEQFVCLRVDLDADSPISHHIRQVRQVSRLREVTALVSFSRLRPTNPTDATASSLSASPQTWLPATEVFGEGIFIELDPDQLMHWEMLGSVRARADRIEGAARESFQQPVVTARGLLLHSVAHALMHELSMDAGYPVASLRERVYDGKDQAGVLIYTATADSAGSLGGLSSQSEQHRLTEVLLNAIRRAQWCTSDPVCIESTGAGIDNLNLAACHACLLVPETSCERRNTRLDRALLVGTQEDPEAGFFSGLLVM